MQWKKIETKWNALWPIVNILNEVCHGFYIPDFEIKIGCKKENLYILLKKLSSLDVSEEESENKIIIKLNDSEIEIIERCFREVLKEIEEWEFSTRIGVSTEEATELVNKLNVSFKNSIGE